MLRSRKTRLVNARSQRGSGLLLALIVVMVVTVVAIGVLRFSSRELAGADAGRKHEALVACADAARQLIMSEFRLAGVSPLDLQPLNVQLDPGGNTLALSGHIGDVTVKGVTMGDSSMLGAKSSGDITNIAFPQLGGSGGKPYKVVAHCTDHDRELEVEFAIRFGI